MELKKKQFLMSTGQSLETISHFLGLNLSSYIGRLYSLVLILLFSFLSQISWRSVCTEHCEKHLTIKFMAIARFFLSTFFVLTTLSISIFHPKQFAFLREEIFIIDSIFESYGAKFSDEDIFFTKYIQDIATAIITLFVIMENAYDIITNNSFQLICFFLHDWYFLLYELVMSGLFAHYINDIYLRFRKLNKIAIKYSRENLSISCIGFSTNSNSFNKCDSTVIIKIRLLQHIHHELYILATKTNTNFGLQLLIDSVLSLNNIIFLLYDMYRDMEKDNNNTGMLIIPIIFVSFYALRFLYISYVCQRLRNKFRQTAIILHNGFLENKSSRAEVIHFSLQLIHENLIFTALGLYEINIPLICSIAGAAVTYLVMFIQLDTIKFAIANNNGTTK
ncbi:putative gustatory receptor 28b [Pogonomyrmex barbatus]|uniref:Gustatory receptor n=1 Tax=Pogonomyrmex barbatus TaxID=144034 RepID=A0A8N1S4Q4_9HYME|nr:putative gustatory receptor 28b [Pogonomyrmex barbatus]